MVDWVSRPPSPPHEPPGSAGVSPASRELQTGPRRRDASAPRNRVPVQGFKARNSVWGNSHPDPMTHSRPLARPSRAFASGKFLSPFPKRFKSPPAAGAEREFFWKFSQGCGGGVRGNNYSTTSSMGGGSFSAGSFVARHLKYTSAAGLEPYWTSDSTVFTTMIALPRFLQ